MASWDSVIDGGLTGKQILSCETTASAASILNINTGVFGGLFITTNTTASAQNLLGVGAVGRNVFEATTTASAQTQLGGTILGRNLFESLTTASSQNHLGAGAIGKILFESITTASAVNQIDASRRHKNVVIKTSAYSITDNDDVVLTSGSFTISLPAAAAVAGREFLIKRIDSTVTAALTVSAGSNIDGASTVALNGINRPFRRILSTGSTYIIVGSSNEI